MESHKNLLARQGRNIRRNSPGKCEATLKRLDRILKSEVKRDGGQSQVLRRSSSRSLDLHEENPLERNHASCSRSRSKSRGRSLRRYYRSVKLAPPTHELKSKIYRLSNGARINFWALPIFEKNDIEVWGGGC